MIKYILILSITFIAIMSIFAKDEPFEDIPIIDEPANIEVEIFNEIYVARDLDGYIAIFVAQEDNPFLLTDINVKTLPLLDQEKLKTGITIDEDYGIAKFIEDYSS
ncbi:MAG: hypothetical protein R3Y12_07975 [Clostridia bacterium]